MAINPSPDVRRPPARTVAPLAAGPARALAATYALFALAAGARSTVQLATHASRAPVAYTLSALAAVIYLVGTVALRRTSPRAHQVALTVCGVELIGVLAVGAWSQADAGAFPDQTVWSGFGAGYGHVPVVLPILGLLWLTRAPRAGVAIVDPTGSESLDAIDKR